MRIVCEKQYDGDYWRVRSGIPTGSNFHRFITDKKCEFSVRGAETYAYQLVAERLGVVSAEPPDGYVTAAVRNGTLLEPEARRFLEYTNGCKVEQVGFCVADSGRYGCSPDGLIGDDKVLEIKAPTPATQIKWLLAGGLPDEHRAQCHAHLLVTERPVCEFLSYCPGLPELFIEVETNDYTLKLAEALGKFLELLDGMHAKIAGVRDAMIDAKTDPAALAEPSYF